MEKMSPLSKESSVERNKIKKKTITKIKIA